MYSASNSLTSCSCWKKSSINCNLMHLMQKSLQYRFSRVVTSGEWTVLDFIEGSFMSMRLCVQQWPLSRWLDFSVHWSHFRTCQGCKDSNMNEAQMHHSLGREWGWVIDLNKFKCPHQKLKFSMRAATPEVSFKTPKWAICDHLISFVYGMYWKKKTRIAIVLLCNPGHVLHHLAQVMPGLSCLDNDSTGSTVQCQPWRADIFKGWIHAVPYLQKSPIRFPKAHATAGALCQRVLEARHASARDTD